MNLQVIGNYKYLTEDMTRLPDVDYLTLDIFSCGHSFGASSFHVLKMSSGIRELTLQLVTRRDSKVTLYLVYGAHGLAASYPILLLLVSVTYGSDVLLIKLDKVIYYLDS